MDVYRARWVLPIEGPPIEDGALAVERGAIVSVGKFFDIATNRSPQAAIHDLGACAILPGFVNAHAHLELTCYRERLPRGPLWPWLAALRELREEAGAAAAERVAVQVGADESLASGVTLIADISRTGMSAEVLKSSPIRKVCFVELISGARSSPRDFASLQAAMDGLQRLVEPERLWLGVSPHAVYTVTREDLIASSRLARSRGACQTIHLLETTDEAEWLQSGRGPASEIASNLGLSRPDTQDAVEFLVQAGAIGRRLLLAHMNYATTNQIDAVARHGASVVWCPRAHRFFGHANHRWREMLRRGVNVCLGTDSAASNASLSMLDETRFLYGESGDVSADAILEMSTLRGAAALGVDHLVGSLKSGKRGDFVAIPVHATGPSGPADALLRGDAGAVGVWVDGVRVR